jgi:drug/metabolite transporter (DMT)-like permease
MALGSVLFSGMNFLARLATQSAPWASVAAVRAVVGALVAFSVARIRGSSLKANDRRMLLGRSVLGTLSMLATFYALSSRTVSLGNTVTLLNLAPVFLAVLAPIFLRERTSLLVGVAIAVSLTGVILVVRPSFVFGGDGAPNLAALPGPSTNATVTVAIFGAFSTSVAMMFLRRVGKSESAESVAFHFSLFAACALGLLAMFDLRMPTARDAACMLGSGLCAGTAQLAMTRAYAMENAARVSGMSYLAVVVSAALGIGLLRERPGPTALVGSVLVIAGGVLLTIPRSLRA